MSRPQYTYRRLTADVENPKADRRDRYRWQKQPVWKTGMRFRVKENDGGGLPSVEDRRGSSLGPWENKDGIEALLRHSEIVEPTWGELVSEYAIDTGTLVDYLVRTGRVTLTRELLDECDAWWEEQIDQPREDK
jgi:hypothetical protein